MIFQHPLAYLLGLEGVALLRGFAGDFDREFVETRLAEVRRLLDDEALAGHEGVLVRRGDALTAYRQWAPSYDEPNGLFLFEEPQVREIIEGLDVGTAVDAACGTGRYAEYLAGLGHRVFGVDRSAEMLEYARRRVPDGEFHTGDLERLPLPDGSADLVVCALALAHMPALQPVMAEFARVLRPGGHLVISDIHHELILRGSVVRALGPDGEPGLTATYRHTTGDHLRAALAAGLRVRRCEEPIGAGERPSVPIAPGELDPGPWSDWPWSLMALVPEANWAAGEIPLTVIWHFQR